MQVKFSTARDMFVAALLLFLLALPFLPVPGDGVARMHVHFRTGQMADPARLHHRDLTQRLHGDGGGPVLRGPEHRRIHARRLRRVRVPARPGLEAERASL